jgi:hypothetical protein
MPDLKYKDLTDKQVLELAKEHVELFQRRARWGGRGVNVPECEKYLAIWRGVLDLWQSYPTSWRSRLSPEARDEIQDAIDCQDYDELLERSK